MKQCLQHAESAPIGQGFISAALLKTVSTPSEAAFCSIWIVDSQVVMSRKFTTFAFFSFSSDIVILLRIEFGFSLIGFCVLIFR
jgi:hypothetical protein